LPRNSTRSFPYAVIKVVVFPSGNHSSDIAAVDLFVLPTIAFQILYCLVILRHG